MRAVFLALGAMLLGVDASAQNLEEVVVTGLRASDYSEMPAVTITKPADFLVQKIQLINDSRSPDLRKKEIIETVEGMLKRATSDRNIALSYGEGFLVPVNLTDESLQIIEDKKDRRPSKVHREDAARGSHRSRADGRRRSEHRRAGEISLRHPSENRRRECAAGQGGWQQM